MPIEGVVLGIGVAIVGGILGYAILENDHPQLGPQPQPGAGPYAPNLNDPNGLAILTCDQAIAALPNDDLRNAVKMALAMSVDKQGLETLAASLDSAAMASGSNITNLQRTALMTAAECARARARSFGPVGQPYPGSTGSGALVPTGQLAQGQYIPQPVLQYFGQQMVPQQAPTFGTWGNDTVTK